MSAITQKTLLAGQSGTKKWLEKYGNTLVCVRYKYDAIRKRKIKTVELVVVDEPWEKNKNRIPVNKIVRVSVKYGEIQLGRLIRAAGGKWNRNQKVWELPYNQAKALGLTHRVLQQ